MSHDRAFARAPGRGGGLGAWLKALAIVALIVVAYQRTALELWSTWMTNDNYSHGPLVPLTSLAIVWLRWGAIRRRAIAPDARGLLLVAFACAMLVVGVRADIFAFQGWSFLVLLLGLSVTFLGGSRTRTLAFPILYLAFMLTFPPVFMNTLSYALKEIAVRASTGIARALGVHMQLDGMSIRLATGELRVENPCSGLRSLLALLATGTLFAYVQPGGFWRRAAVLVAALPIAVLGNVARLVLLIVAADRRGVVWATGAFHDISGYVLYAVALGALLALRRLLTPRAAREARA